MLPEALNYSFIEVSSDFYFVSISFSLSYSLFSLFVFVHDIRHFT